MKTMKTVFTGMLLLALAVAAQAATQGKRVADPNNRNLAYNSPAPAASGCTTATVGKGTIVSIPVAGYSQLCWQASDSTNAAKRIKRHLNNNTAYLPSTGDCIGLNKDMSSVVMKPYSAASAAYTVCYELEKGGVTP